MIDTPFLFQEMENELKTFLLERQVEGDSTDGTFDLIGNLTSNVGKESFINIKSLTRIFALLLNTKVNSVNKKKSILKIAINTALKIWSGQNWQWDIGQIIGQTSVVSLPGEWKHTSKNRTGDLSRSNWPYLNKGLRTSKRMETL